MYTFYLFCLLDDPDFYKRLKYPALDWNCNGVLDIGPVASNINRRPEKLLNGYNDWLHIRLDGGGMIGSLGTSVPHTAAVAEPSLDEIQSMVPPELLNAEDAHPIGTFTTSTVQGNAPLTVYFDAGTATDPDGMIVSWRWEFGDASEGEGKTISHTYTTSGWYTPTLTVTDNDGFMNLVALHPLIIVAPNLPVIDTTAPVITPIVTGTLGLNGWYNSPVVVSWRVSDPESGISLASACDVVHLTEDTIGTMLSCAATNGAGLSTNASINVKIDKTVPDLTLTIQSSPNGISTRNLTITWQADDALAGIASNSATLDGTTITNGAVIDLFLIAPGIHFVEAVATDQAGNTIRVSKEFMNPTKRQYLPLILIR